MEEMILALGDLGGERLRVLVGGELEPVAAALDRLAREELLDGQHVGLERAGFPGALYERALREESRAYAELAGGLRAPCA